MPVVTAELLRGRFGTPFRAALTLAFVALCTVTCFTLAVQTLRLTWAFPGPDAGSLQVRTTVKELVMGGTVIASHALLLTVVAPLFAWLGRQPLLDGSRRFLVAMVPIALVGYALLYGGWVDVTEALVAAVVIAWALLLALCYRRSEWTAREDAP